MIPAPLHACSEPARSIPGKRLVHVAWILALAIAGGVAYSVRFTGFSSHPTAPESTDPTVLARVGGATITESDFLAAWESRTVPSDNNRSERAAELLEDLVRRELLFAEAERTRFTVREDVRSAWKALVVARFREELESRQAASAKVEEAAIEEYFQEHAARFTAPERRRLAVIRIGRTLGATPARQTEQEQEIARVRDLAMSQAAAARDFGNLAALHSSHTASRRNGGDVGWLNRAQADRAWPAAVVEAAFSLSAPGEISPAIPTEEGCFLLKLIDQQDGRLASLESVRERVRQELAQAQESKAQTARFHELRLRHRVEIHPERLAALETSSFRTEPQRSLGHRPTPLSAP